MILNNIYNYLKTKVGLMRTKVESQVEEVVTNTEAAVVAPVDEVSEAIKTYVRDELGRFAKKQETPSE